MLRAEMNCMTQERQRSLRKDENTEIIGFLSATHAPPTYPPSPRLVNWDLFA